MLRELLDYSYHLQRGEFFPETHTRNLSELAHRFPDVAEVVLDQLYRFAMTLDAAAERVSARVARSELSREEAESEMLVTYRYFSPEVIRFSLDWNT